MLFHSIPDTGRILRCTKAGRGLKRNPIIVSNIYFEPGMCVTRQYCNFPFTIDIVFGIRIETGDESRSISEMNVANSVRNPLQTTDKLSVRSRNANNAIAKLPHPKQESITISCPLPLPNCLASGLAIQGMVTATIMQRILHQFVAASKAPAAVVGFSIQRFANWPAISKKNRLPMDSKAITIKLS